MFSPLRLPPSSSVRSSRTPVRAPASPSDPLPAASAASQEVTSIHVAVALAARVKAEFIALRDKMAAATPASRGDPHQLAVLHAEKQELKARLEQILFEQTQNDEHHTTERHVMELRIQQLENDLQTKDASFAEQSLAATDFAEALQQQLADAQAHHVTLTAQLTESSQHTSELQQQLSHTQDQLQSERESFAMQSGAFEGQLHAERAAFAEREAQLMGEVDAARAQSTSNSSAELSSEYQLLQDRFAALDQNYSALQVEADALRSELNVAAAILDEERMNASQKNDSLAILTAEKQQLESRLSEAEFKASKHSEEVAALQQQLAEASHTLHIQESTSAKLQSQLDELSRSSAALDERRVKELGDLAKTAEENKTATSLLTAELTDLHASLDAAESENDRLRKLVPNEKMIQKLVAATREQQRKTVETEKVKMLNEMETQGALVMPVAQLKPLLKTLPATAATSTTSSTLLSAGGAARPKLLSLNTNTAAAPLSTSAAPAPKLLKLQPTLASSTVKLAPTLALKTLGTGAAGGKLLGAQRAQEESNKENAINA